MNRKIVIAVILLVVMGVAGVSSLVTFGILHFTESLHVEEFEKLEEGAYAAVVLDSAGVTVAKIYVMVNLGYPRRKWYPLLFHYGT